MCDFVLMINTNLHPILHRFQVIEDYCSNFGFRHGGYLVLKNRSFCILYISYLSFNLSLGTSIVPSQWKRAWIRPAPKVSAPSQPTEYRPVSVITYISLDWRPGENDIVVMQYIYPALLRPPATLCKWLVYRRLLYNHPTHCYSPPIYQSLCCCHCSRFFLRLLTL